MNLKRELVNHQREETTYEVGDNICKSYVCLEVNTQNKNNSENSQKQRKTNKQPFF